MTVMFCCLLIIQLIFWLGWTHIKSRFMLPAVVPVVMLTLIGGAGLCELSKYKITRLGSKVWGFWSMWVIVGLFLLVLAFIPMAINRRERDCLSSAAIGAIDIFTGAAFAAELARPGLTPQERADILDSAPPAYWINHELDQSSHTLCVGVATPLYFRNQVTYHTVWDRGPFSEVIAQYPENLALWFSELSDKGFTHVLLDETMLRIWQKEGWSDPLLDPVLLRDALDQHAIVLQHFQGRITLYELPSPAPTINHSVGGSSPGGGVSVG